MNAKRWIPVAAALALLVTALVIHQLQSKHPTAPVAVKLAPSTPTSAEPARATPQPIAAAEPELPEEPKLPPGASYAPIAERPHFGQQSIDFIIALKNQGYLGLSKDEMENLLTAYLEVGLERSIHEGSIATAEVLSPTESMITIPPYPEAGARMQAELYRKFAAVLGEERAAKVRAALAPTLYARNFGFGETEQKIRVTLVDPLAKTYDFVHATGTLRVPYKNDFLTFSYGGIKNTFRRDDLNNYRGLVDLLPGGGS